MVSRIKTLVAADMLFLLLLSLSGSTGGIASDIIYYLAFLAPVGVMLNRIYQQRDSSGRIIYSEGGDVIADLKSDFSISKENLIFSLPIIFPAVSVILVISVLTSMLLGVFGYENTAVFDESLFVSIITHALVPAVLEELLFRFAPIKLLSENKKTSLILSSVMFAFAHSNLFQIPYAFIAGLIFSSLYIITGSILPSMLLHFINNTVSLISIYGYTGAAFFIILSSLSIISLAVITIRRKFYKEKLQAIFTKEKIVFSYYPIFFIITSLVLACSIFFV